MPLSKNLAAEPIGTLWLALGGCVSTVLTAVLPDLGIGFAGVSLAFGLTLLTVFTLAGAIGHISGGRLNPVVAAGLWTGGRHPAGEVLPCIVAQCWEGIAGAFDLKEIASGAPAFNLASGLASNGCGAQSLVGCSGSRRSSGPWWRVVSTAGSAKRNELKHAFGPPPV